MTTPPRRATQKPKIIQRLEAQRDRHRRRPLVIRLLERALEQGEIAKQKAAGTTTTQRILTAIACALGAGALAAWAAFGDIPLVPV